MSIESPHFGREEPTARRLLYSSVPLEPYSAVHPDSGEGYAQTSSEHIRMIWNQAYAKAKAAGWVDQTNKVLVTQIDKYVDMSLQGAQNRRILHHASTQIDSSVDRTDPQVRRVLSGQSAPADNFDVLVNYPRIGEIELAKQSHPLDFEATAEMDAAILDILLSRHAELSSGQPRYKRESSHTGIPAAIVVRKQPLAEYVTENGLIVITKRQSLLVRGDEAARGDDTTLDRKIRNPQRFEELCLKIEGYMRYLDEIPEERRRWLQPTTTSYYASYEGAQVEQLNSWDGPYAV